jgi:predicted dehydrogenase
MSDRVTHNFGSNDSNAKQSSGTNRRTFLQNSGKVAAVTALAGMAVPKVHAAGGDTIQVALVGCGGRGTGAAADAMRVQNGPIKLVAVADVSPHKMKTSLEGLRGEFSDRMEVPEDRQFIGFDGYQKALECLKPGDVAIFATPPAFRWVHFKAAIEKGVNVFMEKPVTVDGPTSRRMLALGEESVKKNLKVGVGLMCRHCKARGELFDRIQSGEVGDITLLRAYRMSGPLASCFSGPKPGGANELMWQIERFHSFLWLSGGSYSDFLIHNIDESCWMKNAWPVKAEASGGRHYRGDNVDQNFDSYAVEYTFDDGTKFFLEGRNVAGCNDKFASFAHGTKGSAVISIAGHAPSKCRTYKGHSMKRSEVAWSFPQPEPNPYQLEWDHLIDAIRNDKPYNEVKRGVEASVVTSMGRMAAHTGQIVTFDDMLNCDHEFAPEIEKLVLNGPAPIQANSEGKYPVPQPGISQRREWV